MLLFIAVRYTPDVASDESVVAAELAHKRQSSTSVSRYIPFFTSSVLICFVRTHEVFASLLGLSIEDVYAKGWVKQNAHYSTKGISVYVGVFQLSSVPAEFRNCHSLNL